MKIRYRKEGVPGFPCFVLKKTAPIKYFIRQYRMSRRRFRIKLATIFLKVLLKLTREYFCVDGRVMSPWRSPTEPSNILEVRLGGTLAVISGTELCYLIMSLSALS